MSVRRLHDEQPESFAFTAENLAWAEQQLLKYPADRRQSAVIPLLWRAQEQEGWVSRAAIEHVAEFLSMPPIRVLEVATFYTMFQLRPVGAKAHVQVCGTTPCMLRGAEEIIKICRKRIAEHAHELSGNGDFSWEEVECLGACVNAPMVQVGKDTYEDLTPDSFRAVLDAFAAGKTPKPGPQIDRQFACPEGGPTSLTDPALYDGSMAAAVMSEKAAEPAPAEAKAPAPAEDAELSPEERADAAGTKPDMLSEPAGGIADDLKCIGGVGPKIEDILNGLGIFHFGQIAAWTEENKAWIDGYLKFKGRIDREKWVDQAKVLAEGGDTDFSRRVDAGDVPSSQE